MSFARVACAALLVLATMGAAKLADADTINLDFSGKLSLVPFGGGSLGASAGDLVTGSITLKSITGPTAVPGNKLQYDSADASWSSSLGASGTGAMSFTVGSPTNSGKTDFGLDWGSPGGGSDFSVGSIRANGASSAIPPLTLATVPATFSDWATYFGVAIIGQSSLIYHGEFYMADITDFTFSVTPTATTPLPAGLPLFLTALGGIGFMAARRKTVSAAV